MRPVLVALAVTLGVQTLTSMAMIAPSVLAPVAARDLGIAPQSIGFFASLTYLGAMLSGLATGRFTARYGPLAVCQAAVVLAGAGLALGYLAVAAIVPLAALVIGFGYGVVNPVSSHILARRTPPRMMALVFSIKQTGVPVGGAIAGVFAPPLALALGWTAALPVLAAVCIAAAFVLLPARAMLTEKRTSPAGPSGTLRGVFSGLGRPISLVLSSGALRELSFASLGYAAVQLVFITYFVSYLALGLGYSLVTAGLVYACAHGAGIVGRIAWGAVADRWLAPRTTLAVLGLISALCALLAAAFSADWPLAGVIAVGMLFGASAVGWNGVFLAEVARVAPAGQVTSATGGTQFFTFAGALSGPPLFAAAVWATGSYAWAFGLFALPSAAVAVRLLMRR
ncbi:MAG TPA: MFS transporter [Burkholderiales bacterium]|nr:MFS transporter [Burkholderiales bacterium]